MSGIINSGSFSKALWPGVNAWYGNKYNEWEMKWDKLFDKYTSDRQFEEDVGITGFGLANTRGEGAPINYDSMKQGFITRYRHVEYALGFIVTRVMYEDDQYSLIQKRAEALAYSMRQTKEIVAANIYNRAFAGAGNPTYGDGKTMLAQDHPNISGGTWSNQIAVAADLSEAALETAYIDIRKFTNDRGLRISVNPKSIILPLELEFEATRILKSEYRVGTNNNDISALVATNKYAGMVVVNPYLTDNDAWFIRTDCPDGLKYFERVADTFATDNDFDTDNAKYKARSRYSFGITYPRAIYGSPGA